MAAMSFAAIFSQIFSGGKTLFAVKEVWDLWKAVSGKEDPPRPAAPAQQSATAANTQPEAPSEVKANRAMADEAFELHALLEVTTVRGYPATAYKLRAADFWIVPVIAHRLRPGAVKKLFDAFATQVTTVSRKETVDWTVHAPGPNNKTRPDTPVEKTWAEELNYMGPRIVRGLVGLAVQAQASPEVKKKPGGTEREKGVDFVVDFLSDSQLLKNGSDSAAIATEETAAFTTREALRLETQAHRFAAWMAVRSEPTDPGVTWQNVWEAILDEPAIVRKEQAIKKAKDGEPLQKAHEAFRVALLAEVTCYVQRPGLALRQAIAQTEENQGRRRIAIFLAASALTILILLLALVPSAPI